MANGLISAARRMLIQNLEQVFLDFRSRLDQRLQEAAGDTRRAIGSAHERRREHAETVTSAIERLDATRRELGEILAHLEAGHSA